MTDIYQDEALQAKIFDLWHQGYCIGEIIIELHQYQSHYEIQRYSKKEIHAKAN